MPTQPMPYRRSDHAHRYRGRRRYRTTDAGREGGDLIGAPGLSCSPQTHPQHAGLMPQLLPPCGCQCYVSTVLPPPPWCSSSSDPAFSPEGSGVGVSGWRRLVSEGGCSPSARITDATRTPRTVAASRISACALADALRQTCRATTSPNRFVAVSHEPRISLAINISITSQVRNDLIVLSRRPTFHANDSPKHYVTSRADRLFTSEHVEPVHSGRAAETSLPRNVHQR